MVRTKQRYILCEIVTSSPRRKLKVTSSAVNQATRQAILEAHGDFGMGCLQQGLKVKYVNELTGIVLIRGHRDVYKLLTTSLPFIKKIGQYDAFLHTLHVGGTIRSCQKFVAKYHRQQLQLMLKETTDPEERKEIQQSLLSTSIDLEHAVKANPVKVSTKDDKEES